MNWHRSWSSTLLKLFNAPLLKSPDVRLGLELQIPDALLKQWAPSS